MVHVYDASGTPSKSFSIRWPSWLDGSHIVGIEPSDGQLRGVVADIRSGKAQTIDLPRRADYAIGSGRGAVAFSWARDNQWPDTHYNFVIWQDSSFTDAQDGFPQAWSNDGSKLALLHQFGRHRSPGGWLSVVSSPDAKVLFEDAPPYATGDAAFDQTGTYVAYLTDSGEGPNDPNWKLFLRVVDLAARTYVDLPRDIYGYFYWNVDGTISTVDRDSLIKRTYTPTGDMLDASTVTRWFGARSDDGSTVVYYDVEDGSDDVTVVQDGDTTTIRAPAEVQRVDVPPDGSRIVVSVGGYESYESYESYLYVL